jgi:hypothetical protein
MELIKKITSKQLMIACAIIIILALLALTIPHSSEVIQNFEKPGSALPNLYAFALEILVAYSIFIVCSKSYKFWIKAIAGFISVIAIVASFILNYAHYLSVNSNALYAAGLAALLPLLVALLGAMLPGLIEDDKEVIKAADPVISQEDKFITFYNVLISRLDYLTQGLEVLHSKVINQEDRFINLEDRIITAGVRVITESPQIITGSAAPIEIIDGIITDYKKLGRDFRTNKVNAETFDSRVIEIIERLKNG